MKIDIAIGFYRGYDLWPLVLEGLERNRENINQVIVVNDEPWGEPLVSSLPLKTFAFPEHQGFGVSRVINKGFELAETEYVLHIDDDVLLTPNLIEVLLGSIEPGLLVMPNAREVGLEEAKAMATENDTKPIQTRVAKLCNGRTFAPPWFQITGTIYLAKRNEFLECQWNEDMQDYGGQDYEWAIRWFCQGKGIKRTKNIVPVVAREKKKQFEEGSTNFHMMSNAVDRFYLTFNKQTEDFC